MVYFYLDTFLNVQKQCTKLVYKAAYKKNYPKKCKGKKAGALFVCIMKETKGKKMDWQKKFNFGEHCSRLQSVEKCDRNGKWKCDTKSKTVRKRWNKEMKECMAHSSNACMKLKKHVKKFKGENEDWGNHMKRIYGYGDGSW